MKLSYILKQKMYRIPVVFFFAAFPVLRAQTPTQTENYVKSTEYLTENGESGGKKVNIMYLDGLGREKQAVSYKATPDGKDMIVMYEYDEFGRQVKDFLPAPTNQSSGLIVTDPEAVYNSYYNAYFSTDVYYSEKELEASVLSRPLKQAAPGDDWELGSGKEIKFDYRFNSGNEVKVYKATTTWNPSTEIYDISLAQNGFYARKELYKTVTTDENGNYTCEFRNKTGQTILRRAFVTAGSTAKLPNPDESQQLKADTYYVYDQYGNLTYVIPPLAAEKTSITQAILDGLCYQYKYDKRNRLAERKLPGKGWEYLVYDRQDRLVATQDAEMRKTAFTFPSGMTGKAWAFTKYDAFGRVVYTGLYKSTSGRKALQDLLDGYGQNNEARSTTTFTQNGVTVYYTRANAFPKNHTASNADLLTVNYYDTNYTNLLPAGVSAPSSIEGQATRNGTHTDKNQSLKGLPIASFARVIPGDGWEKAYTFYDRKSRPVGTYKYNHLGGYTKMLSKLDFRSKPEYTRTLHKRTGADAELEVKETFTYDAQERLAKHTHKIGSGAEELLTLNTYNRTGQLDNKKTGGADLTGTNRLQQVDYSYNIRGWLTDINNVNVPYTGRPGGPGEPLDNDDLFSFHIDYNEIGHDGDDAGFPSLYNGNISQTLWKTSSDNTLRGYVYGYDELNRLREAIYHKPGASPAPFPSNYDEKIGYDINGNIKELKRFSGFDAPSTGEMTDELAYTYATDSNKLMKVDDNTNSGTGFKDGTNTGNDYAYDSNANMTSDKNKGITSIKYNHLNLPVEIYWSSTKKINYLYNAAGQKVQKKVTNGTTVHTTDYLDGFQYYNNNLEFFPTAEGYVKQTTLLGQMTFDYVYNYADHLGNVRVSYTKDPQTGNLKILEENHYYPFGLKHQKYADTSGRIKAIEDETGKAVLPDDNADGTMPYRNYDYKYNGKEWQDELGLNMYDMDMRMYDPAIARWVVMDPVVHHSMSPYNAFDNNPVFWADPSGADVVLYGADAQDFIRREKQRIDDKIALDLQSYDFIIGVNKSSAKKIHEDLNTVFGDSRFDAFRSLLTRGRKNNKNKFDKISESAFKEATRGLSGDDLDAVTSVYDAVNSEKEFAFEFIENLDDKLSVSGNDAFAKAQIESYGDFGQLNQTFYGNQVFAQGGEGLSVATLNGTHAFIIDTPLAQHGEGKRALTTFHEGFGHGFPNIKGIKGTANDNNAIRYENLIRRVLKIKTMRDGTNPIHGNGIAVPNFNDTPFYK